MKFSCSLLMEANVELDHWKIRSKGWQMKLIIWTLHLGAFRLDLLSAQWSGYANNSSRGAWLGGLLQTHSLQPSHTKKNSFPLSKKPSFVNQHLSVSFQWWRLNFFENFGNVISSEFFITLKKRKRKSNWCIAYKNLLSLDHVIFFQNHLQWHCPLIKSIFQGIARSSKSSFKALPADQNHLSGHCPLIKTISQGIARRLTIVQDIVRSLTIFQGIARSLTIS